MRKYITLSLCILILLFFLIRTYWQELYMNLLILIILLVVFVFAFACSSIICGSFSESYLTFLRNLYNRIEQLF